MPPKPKPLHERFWPKVVIAGDDECWLWIGTKNHLGYGHIRSKTLSRATIFAHRLAYMLIVGDIPEGMVLDHLCRNPACVNPKHLETVTQRENVLRGNSPMAYNLNKTHCLMGHELSGDNLIHTKGETWRNCRACKHARDKTYRDKMTLSRERDRA